MTWCKITCHLWKADCVPEKGPASALQPSDEFAQLCILSLCKLKFSKFDSGDRVWMMRWPCIWRVLGRIEMRVGFWRGNLMEWN